MSVRKKQREGDNEKGLTFNVEETHKYRWWMVETYGDRREEIRSRYKVIYQVQSQLNEKCREIYMTKTRHSHAVTKKKHSTNERTCVENGVLLSMDDNTMHSRLEREREQKSSDKKHFQGGIQPG